MIAVWPRGGGKSTTAELLTIALAARNVRSYCLYCCGTQKQADDHVGSIAARLESPQIAIRYPELASRLVGKYGHSKGWRRNRLRTRSGFTVDAIGLDTAARGTKLDEARPDLQIFDDLDDDLDTKSMLDRKMKLLTRKFLPAGTPDMAVLGIQNLLHVDSIFSQLIDGRAEFLLNRRVSGPYPALRNMQYEQTDKGFVLTDGEPTWDRLNLEVCQRMVNDMGFTAFRVECQHEVDQEVGSLFGHIDFQHCVWGDLPDLVRIVVWVDPAVTETDQSDAHGICAMGIDSRGRLYVLYGWEARTSPEDSLKRAITKAIELKADSVGVETDQGGDTWKSTYREACRALQVAPLKFRSAKAGEGHGPKMHRASRMLADYERGQIIHVLGTHATIEAALRRFGIRKPFDLVDAMYWAWTDLRHPGRSGRVVGPIGTQRGNGGGG